MEPQNEPTRADVLAAKAIVSMLDGTGVEVDADILELSTKDPLDYESRLRSES